MTPISECSTGLFTTRFHWSRNHWQISSIFSEVYNGNDIQSVHILADEAGHRISHFKRYCSIFMLFSNI